ncbi:regulatory protein RecX, partial [Paeniclostridium sordellii]|nr:regulatory protein RecX [Paeniclostridium sordellii]
LALLDRKPPRAKNKRDAAYRRLAQKGFGASVASTAARIWSEGKERQ